MQELTKKEKEFADEYLETGHKTKSAIKAYDIGSKGGSKDKEHIEKTASAIAAENLGKPRVIQYLEDNSEKAVLNIIELGDQRVNLPVALGANKDILDRAGYKPIDKSQSVVVNVSVNDEYLDELAKKMNEDIKATIINGSGKDDTSMDAKVSDKE